MVLLRVGLLYLIILVSSIAAIYHPKNVMKRKITRNFVVKNLKKENMTNISINIGIYLVKMFQKRKLKKSYKSSLRKETVQTTTMVPLKTSETSSTTVSKISTKDNSYTVKENNDSLKTETSQGTTTLSTHFPTTEISSTPVSVTENPIVENAHTLTVDKSEMKDEIEYKNKATSEPEIVETTTDKQTLLLEDVDDDDSSKSEDDDYVLGSADLEDSV